MIKGGGSITRNDALVGHTGFVGSNLAKVHAFTSLYRSTDIENARGGDFDLLVCAGVRAEKWIANKDEAGDLAGIERLMDVLRTTRAHQAVLISTTDVYADTRGRTEADPVDIHTNQPYGRNRALLEVWFRERFPNALIVRLPGLFGPGLKKNVVHDLIKDHEVEKINTDGVHQYYDVRWLWNDVQRALVAGINTLNVATPPMKVVDLCRDVFGVEYQNPAPRPATYDMRSMHDQLFGGVDGYLYNATDVLSAMKEFVNHHPDRRPLKLPPIA
ncbi:MAG: NAD-dependent epimerase/dehydratase family protein [Flavobacteriales bacterium]|nr:NAD-dependent epimerase/dehydratase family protein [Flavobacteriales bacterium]